VALDEYGTVYAGSYHTGTVFRLDDDGVGRPVLEAGYKGLSGQILALDGAILASEDDQVVRKDLMTGVESTFAGDPDGAWGCDEGDGGPAEQAHLEWATDLVAGPDGSVYIADGDLRCVRRVDPLGTIETWVGTCHPEECGDLTASDPGSFERRVSTRAAVFGRAGQGYGLRLWVYDDHLYVFDRTGGELRDGVTWRLDDPLPGPGP
jgi:hypothetical protein